MVIISWRFIAYRPHCETIKIDDENWWCTRDTNLLSKTFTGTFDFFFKPRSKRVQRDTGMVLWKWKMQMLSGEQMSMTSDRPVCVYALEQEIVVSLWAIHLISYERMCEWERERGWEGERERSNYYSVWLCQHLRM